MRNTLFEYILHLADNALILGHRLSELCGLGPTLETDMAITNISLDLFGQVRNYYRYAATLSSDHLSEDDLAFSRLPNEYKNILLVEQPNIDFAHIIVRQFLFDSYHRLLLDELSLSKDTQLRAIALKSIKEVKYHLRFSTSWLHRLGDGTEESNLKTQVALDKLWLYTNEFFELTEIEKAMYEEGVAPDPCLFKAEYFRQIKYELSEAQLTVPETTPHHIGGKSGIHSEHFGHILSTVQYMQRTYPKMNW